MGEVLVLGVLLAVLVLTHRRGRRRHQWARWVWCSSYIYGCIFRFLHAYNSRL